MTRWYHLCGIVGCTSWGLWFNTIINQNILLISKLLISYYILLWFRVGIIWSSIVFVYFWGVDVFHIRVLGVNQTCSSLKNWKKYQHDTHTMIKCIVHRFTMKNKSPCMWRASVVGGDGFTMRRNVRNRPYTYYTVQPTVPSTAEKVTCVIDKSARRKNYTKPKQNKIVSYKTSMSTLTRLTVVVVTRETILSPLAARDDPTYASEELLSIKCTE